jgi:hypothetical protein
MDRFTEQISFLNQKIDHLQEEQMELEQQSKHKEE